MNIIGSLLKWLWKWQKGSKHRYHGEPTEKYLGAREKSMLDDVRNFLQEIRMQDKLPDILKRHRVSVDEFKRLEDLRKLYLRSRDGDINAQRELNERYSNDPAVFDEEMNVYNRIKEQMHNEGEDFVEHPDIALDIPDLPDEPTYSVDYPEIMSPEHRAEYEQISDIQRRWSELAMEDVPQTDERTEALERVRTMMGNARRISNDRERFSNQLGISSSQSRQMADATQWISRSNEELDSIRSGDYRSWADRSMDDLTSDESRPNIFQRMTNSDSTRERNEQIIRNRFTGEDE
jgi:hypothetical protein